MFAYPASMICCGWRPGDTLLHWAVRRGDATSDDLLLALLEAGYDADALNLSCPCFCMSATTPREIAKGHRHEALLEFAAPGIRATNVVWQVEQQDDLEVMTPGQMQDDGWVPLERIARDNWRRDLDDVRHGEHAPGSAKGEFLMWGHLVDSVRENNATRLTQLAALEEEC